MKTKLQRAKILWILILTLSRPGYCREESPATPPVVIAGITGATVGATGTGGSESGCSTPVPDSEELTLVQTGIRQREHTTSTTSTAAFPITTIQVYFHILSTNRREGDAITAARVDAQITTLNRAFSGDFGGVNTPFRFHLHSIDRTENTTWYNMTHGSAAERDAKAHLRRGTRQDLNVYAVRTTNQSFLHTLQGLLIGQTSSWATFPWRMWPSILQPLFHGPLQNPLGAILPLAVPTPSLDGVVLNANRVPGRSADVHGKELVHEVGHWLGLYHTFQGGCTAPGDQVDDTPAEATPASGCPTNRDSCPTSPGLDPIHNYMDYSSEACMTQFTAGQRQRMITCWVIWRAGS